MVAMDFSIESETSSDDLKRLSLDVADDEAEIARGVLMERASRGWSERRERPGRVSFDLWIADEQVADVPALESAMADAGVAVDITVDDEDSSWRDGLRRHHQPVDVRGRIRVRPPWSDPAPGVCDVVIDPGMAFGTGQHATTRACLDLLLDLPPGRVLDVGTGSGVLAITAAKLGHDCVIAIDLDPLATEATTRNAEVNRVHVSVICASGTEDPLPPSDIVIANITRRDVRALASQLADPLPAHAVLSGFLEDDIASAIEPWYEIGFTQRRVVVDGEWAAVGMQRP